MEYVSSIYNVYSFSITTLDRLILLRHRENKKNRISELQEAKRNLDSFTKSLLLHSEKEVVTSRDKYRATANVLIRSRRLLIKELVSIFRLRRVQRVAATATAPAPANTDSTFSTQNTPPTTSSLSSLELSLKLFYDEPQEYRIINVGFSAYGDYLSE